MQDSDRPWSIFNEVLDNDTEAYFNAFNDRVYSSKPDLLGNSNPAHAVYVIKRFVDLAQQRVRMYTGSLQRVSDRPGYTGLRIYSDPNLIESFRAFLSKSPGNSLQIVIEDEIDGQSNSHPLVEYFKSISKEDESCGKVELRKVSGKFRKAMEEKDLNRHMVLVDDTYMRSEINHEKSTAILLFNDASNISKFTEFFDEFLWSNAELIPY